MDKGPQRRVKGGHAKSILRLPDLEVAKAAVINSLSCPDAQRGYRHAIDEFVDWYLLNDSRGSEQSLELTLDLARVDFGHM